MKGDRCTCPGGVRQQRGTALTRKGHTDWPPQVQNHSPGPMDSTSASVLPVHFPFGETAGLLGCRVAHAPPVQVYLCVNSSGPGGSQRVSHRIWASPWGCVRMGFTFESVDCMEQVALPRWCSVPSVEGLSRAEACREAELFSPAVREDGDPLPSVLPVLGLQTWTGIYTSGSLAPRPSKYSLALLGAQMAHGTSWAFSARANTLSYISTLYTIMQP